VLAHWRLWNVQMARVKKRVLTLVAQISCKVETVSKRSWHNLLSLVSFKVLTIIGCQGGLRCNDACILEGGNWYF